MENCHVLICSALNLLFTLIKTKEVVLCCGETPESYNDVVLRTQLSEIKIYSFHTRFWTTETRFSLIRDIVIIIAISMLCIETALYYTDFNWIF